MFSGLVAHQFIDQFLVSVQKADEPIDRFDVHIGIHFLHDAQLVVCLRRLLLFHQQRPVQFALDSDAVLLQANQVVGGLLLLRLCHHLGVGPLGRDRVHIGLHHQNLGQQACESALHHGNLNVDRVRNVVAFQLGHAIEETQYFECKLANSCLVAFQRDAHTFQVEMLDDGH